MNGNIGSVTQVFEFQGFDVRLGQQVGVEQNNVVKYERLSLIQVEFAVDLRNETFAEVLHEQVCFGFIGVFEYQKVGCMQVLGIV